MPMLTMGYCRAITSMIMGNLGKATVQMVKEGHAYLFSILYLVISQ